MSDRRCTVDQSVQGGLPTGYINICLEAGQSLENSRATSLTAFEVFGYRVFAEDIYVVPSFFCEPHNNVQLGAVLLPT